MQRQYISSKRQASGPKPKENDGGQGGTPAYPWPDGEHPVIVDIQDLDEADIVIAVMGPTGSGKSTFVCSASGQRTAGVGDGLKSYTSSIQATRFWDRESGQRVVLVDTPGFDDTHKSDLDVLNMISDWLNSSYKRNKLLSGIFYLHRITDNRMAGTSLRNLKVFQKLCGADALEKVYLTTTMWDEVDENVCKQRLEELESQYWRTMIIQGANVVRCKHVDETPKELIRGILERESNCRLLLQEEMIEMKKAMRETSAGRELCSQLEDLVRMQMAILEKLMGAAGQTRDPKLVSELERECAELRAKMDGKLREMQELKLPWMKRFLVEPFNALRFLVFRIFSHSQPIPRGVVPPQGPNFDQPSSNPPLSSEADTQSRRSDPDIPSESNSHLLPEAEELTRPRISHSTHPPTSTEVEELKARFDAQTSSPLPPNLTPFITKQYDHHIASGGFGDIYKCLYTNGDLSKEVAVKALRLKLPKDGDRSHKMLRRELGIWKRLDHKNVVPFLGVAYGFGMRDTMSLVLLWMPNGSLQDFLTMYDGNLNTGHRLQLLLDIASGLHHLHSQENPIIHGDLTSTNVLIDADYTARLTDFGYASVVGGTKEYLQRSTRNPGAWRFIAPEQVDPDGPERTTKSDIYSFGCVALQVLSGKRPWLEVPADAAVVVRLSRGQNPNRPTMRPIDDLHWDLIQRCWSPVDERPSPEVIISNAQRFIDNCRPFPVLCELVPSWPRQDESDVGSFGGTSSVA